MQTLPVLCCSDSVNANLQMYPWCAKENFIVKLLYSLISVIFCCSIYSRHNCSLLEAAGKIQQFFFLHGKPGRNLARMRYQSRGNSNAGPEASSFSLDPKSFYDHCWGQNYMYLKSVFDWQHIVITLIFSHMSITSYFKHLSLDKCEKPILASDHSVFLALQLLFRFYFCLLLY